MNIDIASELLTHSSIGKDWKVDQALTGSKRGRLYRIKSGKHSKRIMRIYDATNQISDQGIQASLLRQSTALTLKHPQLLDIHHMELIPFRTLHYIMLVMEEATSDLKTLIQTNHHILPPKEKATHLYHILQGLHFIHSNDMVHRKVNPHNILLDKTNNVKCGDFQDMSIYSHTKGKHAALSLTGEQLPYTSPELLLGHNTHESSSDIWSFGIIMHEYLTGDVPFTSDNVSSWWSSESKVDPDKILTQVFNRLGTLDISEAINTFDYVPQTKQSFKHGFKDNQSLYGFSPKQWNAAIDLMDKCLRLKSKRRITALEALNHPFFQMFGFKGTIKKGRSLKPPVSPKLTKNELALNLRSQWIKQGISDIKLGHTDFHIVALCTFLFDFCLHLFPDYDTVSDIHSIWCACFLISTKLLGDVSDNQAYDSLIGLICDGKNQKVLQNEYKIVNYMGFMFFHPFLIQRLPVKLSTLENVAKTSRNLL